MLTTKITKHTKNISLVVDDFVPFVSFVVKQGLALSGCDLTWLLERDVHRQDLVTLGSRSPLTNIGNEIFHTGQVDVQFVAVPTYDEGIVGIAVAEG